MANQAAQTHLVHQSKQVVLANQKPPVGGFFLSRIYAAYVKRDTNIEQRLELVRVVIC